MTENAGAADATEQLRVATVRLVGEVGRLSVWLRAALVRSFNPEHDAVRPAVNALHVLLAGPTPAELDLVVSHLVVTIAKMPAADRQLLASAAANTSLVDEFAAADLMLAAAAFVAAADRYATPIGTST